MLLYFSFTNLLRYCIRRQHVQPYSAWEHREEIYRDYPRILGVERDYPRVSGINRYDTGVEEDSSEGREGGTRERGRDRDRGRGREGREESRRERRRRSRRDANEGEDEREEVEEGLLEVDDAAHSRERESTYGQRAYVQCYSTIHYVDAIAENPSSSSASASSRDDSNYADIADGHTGTTRYRNTEIAGSFYPDIGDYDLDNDDDLDSNCIVRDDRNRNVEFETDENNDDNNENDNNNYNNDWNNDDDNSCNDNNNNDNNNTSTTTASYNNIRSNTGNCVGSPYRLRERERNRQNLREADRERNRMRSRETLPSNNTVGTVNFHSLTDTPTK